MKSVIITLLLLALGNMTCYSQSPAGHDGLREEVRVLIDSIIITNNHTDDKVANRLFNRQYDLVKKLRNLATDQELTTLSNHTDVLVRSYAFSSLAQRRTTDVFPILIQHLSDTASVLVARGCIIEPETVGDYFLYVAGHEKEDTGRNKLTVSQRSLVDSILIYDKTIRLGTKYSLIAWMKPDPQYYKRIREIALTEKRPEAMFALAKYKNEKDIPLVKRLFQKEKDEYYGILAALEFPDSSFYPYLTRIFQRDWKREHYYSYQWERLYQALAKYPIGTTYRLFEKTIEIKDHYRYQEFGEYLMVAIQLYPNKLFEPLKDKIKLDEDHLEDVKDKLSPENQ